MLTYELISQNNLQEAIMVQKKRKIAVLGDVLEMGPFAEKGSRPYS